MQARKLRLQGKSYGKIAQSLSIAKSTASLLCRDIKLSEAKRQHLYTKQIEMLSKGPQSSRERRKRQVDLILQNASKELSRELTNETFKLLGAMLYWAEGSKTEYFGFTNSDPYMILFMVRWLNLIFEIKPTEIKSHLNIYQGQNEQQIKGFWSDVTGIPIRNFGKTFVKPKNKNYKKNTLYYGTIKIRILKGTDLRYRVFGWIAAMLKHQNINVDPVEQRWQPLMNYARNMGR